MGDEDISKMLAKIPDSAENLRKAQILKKWLVADERGNYNIREMEMGIFEKSIPDEILAATARNLFEKWRTDFKLTKSFDLCNLYLTVLSYIKTLISTLDYIKLKDSGEYLSDSNQQKLLSLAHQMDMDYHKQMGNLGASLAIDRKTRLQKEVKATNNFGDSITLLLSNREEDEDKKKRKEEEEELVAEDEGFH